jgi:hypothetical protein
MDFLVQQTVLETNVYISTPSDRTYLSSTTTKRKEGFVGAKRSGTHTTI